MPEIRLSIPHLLPREEAISRIRNLIGELRARHAGRIEDAHETWTAGEARFDLTVQGFKASGTLTVEDAEVRIALEYPFLLAPFGGRIEQYIREEAETLLR